MVDPPRFMDAWQSRQAGLDQPATTEVAPLPVRRDARPHYVAAALAGEVEKVRTAVKGTRNGQLNTSAVKLGRLVASGLLEETVAITSLAEAAAVCGLEPQETRATIASGMRYGLQHPRDPGEARNTGSDARPVRDLTAQLGGVAVVSERRPQLDLGAYLQPAGTFLQSMPDKPEPLWGRGDQVLWAQGEALMIAGGPGLGKTTLAGQLVRARIGWQSTVLDLPVMEGERVLYLMMDRPQQIGRRLMQQFTPDELEKLDERMTLGVGPPPRDMARDPDLLTQLCVDARADTVVVDSLKDAAIGLTEDEVGAGWNRARQLAVAAGVQVLELHHLVKRGANGKDPETLADVYGSAWLTAGVGSCLVLLGEAGSPVVKMRHIKPVAEPFGPAELQHDHARGVTTVHHRVDLGELLAITQVQTARSAACQLFDTDKPKPSETERARRLLEKLVEQQRAVRRIGGTTTRPETTYHPLTARTLTELRTPPAELTLDLED